MSALSEFDPEAYLRDVVGGHVLTGGKDNSDLVRMAKCIRYLLTQTGFIQKAANKQAQEEFVNDDLEAYVGRVRSSALNILNPDSP